MLGPIEFGAYRRPCILTPKLTSQSAYAVDGDKATSIAIGVHRKEEFNH
jgi:hypothetical protein